MCAALKLTRFDRLRIEQTVEQLIALLDAADGDPDFEDDAEDDGCEDEGFDADSEPSLGWPERHERQGFVLSLSDPRVALDGEVNQSDVETD